MLGSWSVPFCALMQLVGLTALHWSATIALVATLLMVYFALKDSNRAIERTQNAAIRERVRIRHSGSRDSGTKLLQARASFPVLERYRWYAADNYITTPVTNVQKITFAFQGTRIRGPGKTWSNNTVGKS